MHQKPVKYVKMKKISLLLGIIFLPLIINGQEHFAASGESRDYRHHYQDVTLSLSPDLLFNTPNGTQFTGGLRMRFFAGRYVSFDADIVFGRDYFHAGPGLIGVPVWMLISRPQGISYDDSEHPLSDFLFTLAALALAAEHTSFHIPAGSATDISPYLSALRYRVSYPIGVYNDPRYAGEQLSFALGLEVNKYFNRFSVASYAEWNIGYKDHLSGINLGIWLGYNFYSGR